MTKCVNIFGIRQMDLTNLTPEEKKYIPKKFGIALYFFYRKSTTALEISISVSLSLALYIYMCVNGCVVLCLPMELVDYRGFASDQ